MYTNKILETLKDDTVQEAVRQRLRKKHISVRDFHLVCSPDWWANLYECLAVGEHHIERSVLGFVPKDDGTQREIQMSKRIEDKVVFIVCFSWLMEHTKDDMIHPNSLAYQSGISCHGIIDARLREIQRRIMLGQPAVKFDFTKYFDRVPRHYIMLMFSFVENVFGKDRLLDAVKEYYFLDEYRDPRLPKGEDVVHQYKSLKQGCAVAAWLANVVMYHLDARLAELDGLCVRYCDDILFVGPDAHKAYDIIKETMEAMSTDELNMELNDRKVKWLAPDQWFTFLGWNIRGGMKSLSKKYVDRIDADMHAILRSSTPKNIVSRVNRYLYKGKYPQLEWLARINSEHDIRVLDEFFRDIIRAGLTGHKTVGHLGCNPIFKKGCIMRHFNLEWNDAKRNMKLVPEVEGYTSLWCMVRNRRISRNVSDALIRDMV